MRMNEGELVAFVVSAEGGIEYLPMHDTKMVDEGCGVFSSPIKYEVLREAVGGLIEYVPFMSLQEGNSDNIIPLPDGRWGRLLELIVNEEGKLLGMPSNIVGATFANWGVGPNQSGNFFIVGPTIVVAEVVDVGETDEEDFMQYVGNSIPLEVWATYGQFQTAMMLTMVWMEWYNTHTSASPPEGGEEE
tara:strand:+ start:2661 stop:3227 length:567 start_codon:yes stop_codon:yes gene_type:complete